MVRVERRYQSPAAALAAVRAAQELGLGVTLANRLAADGDGAEPAVEWLLTLTAEPPRGDGGVAQASRPMPRPESVISLREHEPVAMAPEPDLFVADPSGDTAGRHRRHARPDA